MNPERALFLKALGISDTRERSRMLDDTLADDPQKRHRIQQLLDAHEQSEDSDLLQSPWTESTDTIISGETDTTPDIDSHASPRTEPDLIPAANIHALPAPGKSFSEPCRIDHYHLLKVIGRGGMGAVIQARDTNLNRIVAIKVVTSDSPTNLGSTERFLREARLAAAVQHDNIVTIHHVAESDGLPYLVMEFVDGLSLQDLLDEGHAFTPEEIQQIGAEVAAGLAAAHAHGLIHRDIKPANILIDNRTGRARITDFGLARGNDDGRITSPGVVAGTPQYMAPEQARGRELDHRADLFSLGSVMYALSAGKSPFHADSALISLHKVCSEAAQPITEVNTDVPEHLAAVIMQLLEKAPAARFLSADAVIDALGGVGDSCEATAAFHQYPIDRATDRHVSGKALAAGTDNFATSAWRRKRMIAVGLVLLTALLAITELTGTTSFATAVIRYTRGDGTIVVQVHDPTITVIVDGERIGIDASGQGRIWVTPGEYQVVFRRENPFHTETVEVTKRDRRLVTITREVEQQSIADRARTRTGPSDQTVPQWSKPARLTDWKDDGTIYGRPSVSADGLMIVFESDRDGGHGDLDLWYAERDSITDPFGPPQNAGSVNTAEREVDPCISADGLTIIFTSRRDGGRRNLWMSQRASRDQEFSEAVRMGGEVNSPLTEGGAQLTADGLTLLFHSDRPGGFGGHDIWMAERKTSDDEFETPVNLGQAVNSPEIETSPHMSADGLELWFVSRRIGSIGERDLWVASRDSNSVPFTNVQNFPAINSERDEESPSVTEDGRLLIFESMRGSGERNAEDIWFSIRK